MYDYIKQGDCLNLMNELPDNSINLILCDLPYGITASNWDKALPMPDLWKQYRRILTHNGTVLLFSSGIFTPRVMNSALDLYKYRLVWVKRNSTNFVHAKNKPLTKSEDICVFSKGSMGHASLLGKNRMTYNPQGLIPCKKIGKQGKSRFGTIAGNRPSHLGSEETFVREFTNYPCDVITDYPELPSNKKIHTNEKPVELLKYLIQTYSNENDVILDNCAGSGSTCEAAYLTGRHYVGYELDETYYLKANERLTKLRGGTL